MSGGFAIYDRNHGSKRVCGSCQTCCKLLPVVSIKKPGWTKCQHQRVGKGCMIYNQSTMPFECRVWSCRWLTSADTADMARPDRCHYVIDAMPDMVRVENNDGSSFEHIAIQVWADPAFPNCHRDPALRAYIDRRGELDRMATIVRWSNTRACILVPACLSKDGKPMEFYMHFTDDSRTGNRFVDALAGGEL